MREVAVEIHVEQHSMASISDIDLSFAGRRHSVSSATVHASNLNLEPSPLPDDHSTKRTKMEYKDMPYHVYLASTLFFYGLEIICAIVFGDIGLIF